MAVSTPQEIIFAVGILLFAAALVFVGIILRTCFQLIRAKTLVWLLPFVSSGLVLLFALIHFHTTISFVPKLNPFEQELISDYFQLQFFGSVALFVASVLAIIASGT